MANPILRLKTGNTSRNNAYTGLDGEITIDKTNKTIRIHNGVVKGGMPLNVTNTNVGMGEIHVGALCNINSDQDVLTLNGKTYLKTGTVPLYLDYYKYPFLSRTTGLGSNLTYEKALKVIDLTSYVGSKGAQALNHVAIDNKGAVYVFFASTDNKTLYMLTSTNFTTWTSKSLVTANYQASYLGFYNTESGIKVGIKNNSTSTAYTNVGLLINGATVTNEIFYQHEYFDVPLKTFKLARATSAQIDTSGTMSLYTFGATGYNPVKSYMKSTGIESCAFSGYCFFNGYHCVFINDKDYFYTSIDFTSWTKTALKARFKTNADATSITLKINGKRALLVNKSNKTEIAVTENLRDWYYLKLPFNVIGVCSYNGLFVAWSNENLTNIYTSPDGLKWKLFESKYTLGLSAKDIQGGIIANYKNLLVTKLTTSTVASYTNKIVALNTDNVVQAMDRNIPNIYLRVK